MFAANDLQPQTLRYSVDYKGQNAGELELVISRDNGGYEIEAISHLSMLAKMFLDSTTVTARFEKYKDSYRLVSGEEISTENNKVRRGFTVDYASSTINFTKNDALKFDPAITMDADAFPLLLVLDNSQIDAGKQLLSVSPKRGRMYTHEKEVNESVKVPAGEFQTLLEVVRRQDDPERFIKYWLRQDDRIPVKIITGTSGKATTLQLLP